MFTTNFLAAGWIAAGVATAAIGQPPAGGKLFDYDPIDSDQDGVVPVTEMKAAGVIK